MATMFKVKPVATDEQLAEADLLEKSAHRHNESAEESFQRSDTDGFLSQWASDLSAQQDRRNASLLRDGGAAQFPVLVDKEGNIVATKIFKFPSKYRHNANVRLWRLPDDFREKNHIGRKWVPVGERSRVQKELGLHEEDRWFAAQAVVDGEGHGLSGNAWVTVVQKE